MTINFKRGFTLIELLVVIAIIGILASVVLASLNSARGKGANAAIKSNLAAQRVEAEMYYDANTSYNNVCALTGTNVIGDGVAAAATAGGVTYTTPNDNENLLDTGVVCHDSITGWVAASILNGGGYWCVDYTGAAMMVATTSLNTNGDVTCN